MARSIVADAASIQSAEPRVGAVRLRVALFVTVFLLLLGSAGRMAIRGDAAMMCDAARGLVRDGTPHLSNGEAGDSVRGADGQFWSNYSLLSIVQCIPVHGASGTGRFLGLEERSIDPLVVELVPAAIGAFLAIAFHWLALLVGASSRNALLLALGLVFTTPLFVYSRLLYSESLQALVVVLASGAWILAARKPSWWRLLAAGLLLSVALHTKTTLALLGIVWPLYFLSEQPTPKAIRDAVIFAGLGLLPGIAGLLWYNDLRFDDAFRFGYDTSRNATIGFSVPLLAGLHGLLLSTGKSLFLYAPLLLLGVLGLPRFGRTRGKALALACAAFALAYTCVIAKWWSWSGDWGWGPRLLAPILPLVLLPAVAALEKGRPWRIAAGVLAAVGFVVTLLGVALTDVHFLALVHRLCQPIFAGSGQMTLRDDILLSHFVPEFSPIVGHAWLAWLKLRGEAWTPGDWTPWQSMGVRAWEVSIDPTPPEWDFWWDKSELGPLIGGVLALLALGAVVWLVLEARRFGRGRR